MAMHRRQSLLFLFCLSLVQHGRPLDSTPTTPSCQKAHNASNSFLWAIDREPPSYLFGTIHVPYTQVWNHIAENTKHAFIRADYVYFELDLTDPYTVSDLVNCQLLPRGESLANILPRPLYRRLKRHLQYVKLMMPTWMSTDQKSRGLYADYLFNAITGNWERKRPVWIMLMVNSLTEDEIRSRGVPVLDLYLAQEAQRLGKRMGAVEKVEEQCVPLNELNLSQVVFALNHTLWQHESSRSSSGDGSFTGDDLISHYNCGDLDSLVLSHSTAQVPHLANISNHDQGLAIAKKIDEYFRQELIYKRNQRMALRVQELIEKNPNKSFFFAFGAGHFLGNNSVIEKLQAKGFQVENTSPQQPLYLGKNYKRRRKKQPRLLADTSAELSLPPVIITGNLEYLDPFYDRRRHRQRHGFHRGRRKGRKRNKERNRSGEEPTPTDSYHLKRPHFNDLWVRLDATSFGPNSFFMLENTADTTSSPSPKYAMYNSSSNLIDSATLMVSIVTTLCVMYVTDVVR